MVKLSSKQSFTSKSVFLCNTGDVITSGLFVGYLGVEFLPAHQLASVGRQPEKS